MTCMNAAAGPRALAAFRRGRRGQSARPSQPGGADYVRRRDLTRLLALWPKEVDDESRQGGLRIVQRLRSALRAERKRCRAGHWSYDLNRHLSLLHAYKAEIAALERTAEPERAQANGS